jgi:hypothetical protein
MVLEKARRLKRGAMSYTTISETQIVRAMRFFEEQHIALNGPLDGVNLPVACSKLADVLGVMWYDKTSVAEVDSDSEVAQLVHACEAG